MFEAYICLDKLIYYCTFSSFENIQENIFGLNIGNFDNVRITLGVYHW